MTRRGGEKTNKKKLSPNTLNGNSFWQHCTKEKKKGNGGFPTVKEKHWPMWRGDKKPERGESSTAQSLNLRTSALGQKKSLGREGTCRGWCGGKRGRSEVKEATIRGDSGRRSTIEVTGQKLSWPKDRGGGGEKGVHLRSWRVKGVFAGRMFSLRLGIRMTEEPGEG